MFLILKISLFYQEGGISLNVVCALYYHILFCEAYFMLCNSVNSVYEGLQNVQQAAVGTWAVVCQLTTPVLGCRR